MQKNLTGNTALVTGASRGIGRGISIALGECGAKVVVNYNTNAKAASETVEKIIAAGGSAIAVQADVSKKADVTHLFEKVREFCDGCLDILVNNAGGRAEVAPIANMREDVWDDCISVNLKGVFLCTQAAIPLLPDSTGRIINVTSISARSGASVGLSHYAAAKAGLSNFTRNSAKELAGRGITVNAIAPGVIYTDLHKDNTPKEDLEQLKMRIPLQRLGEAEDCAGAVVFLCSLQASYITGEIIEINGGMLMA